MYTTWSFAVSLHSRTDWSPWNQFSVLVLFQEWPSELFLTDPSVWGSWAVQFLSLPAHPAVRNPFAYSLLPPSELRILWQACYSLASIPQIWEFVEISCCLLLLCVLAACLFNSRASLMAQMVKNLPAVQKTWIWFLGWKDPLQKGMATHSSILAWRIPWTKEPCGLQFMGLQRVGHDWVTKCFHFCNSDCFACFVE